MCWERERPVRIELSAQRELYFPYPLGEGWSEAKRVECADDRGRRRGSRWGARLRLSGCLPSFY
jgi:hypothetical protein